MGKTRMKHREAAAKCRISDVNGMIWVRPGYSAICGHTTTDAAYPYHGDPAEALKQQRQEQP